MVHSMFHQREHRYDVRKNSSRENFYFLLRLLFLYKMSMYKRKLLHFLFSLFNICKLRASDMILLIPPSLCARNKRRHTKKEKERHLWFQGLCQCQSCVCAHLLERGLRRRAFVLSTNLFRSFLSFALLDHNNEPGLPKYAYVKGVIV